LSQDITKYITEYCIIIKICYINPVVLKTHFILLCIW